MKRVSSFRADFLVVGCGLAGSVFARAAADSGRTSLIIEKRPHIGGNCYTHKDEETDVEVHTYGPHIFHTSSTEIWEFINRFTKFNNFVNRVKACHHNQIYSLPINLHTINQFFKKCMCPEEAKSFIESLAEKSGQIDNFEDYIVAQLGIELYEAFYKYYSIKQWGIDPRHIAVSTAKRLPIRFHYDDNYFTDVYQGIPVDGYTAMFRRMLDASEIQVALSTDFSEFSDNWRERFKALVFTGSIDEYFGYTKGFLPYRTVTFKELRGKEILGTSNINYPDPNVPYTRIHEHKWFTPERKFSSSIGFEEYSSATDSRNAPYYPVRNFQSEGQIRSYEQMKETEKDVIFAGRLAEFKYHDMHQVIASSLAKFRDWKARR